MFFNYIFKTKFDEETIFCTIETISEVATRYARCSSLFLKKKYRTISINLLNQIYSCSGNYDDDVLKLSKFLKRQIADKKYSLGFAIFTINLLFKRFAHLMAFSDRQMLRAPLNNAELREIKFRNIRNMSKVDNFNYKQLMKYASNYSLGLLKNKPTRTFNSLYEWELWFWDNN